MKYYTAIKKNPKQGSKKQEKMSHEKAIITHFWKCGDKYHKTQVEEVNVAS